MYVCILLTIKCCGSCGKTPQRGRVTYQIQQSSITVSYAGPSSVYLPRPTWPHTLQTGGCRPLQPLRGKLAPPSPSSVSGPESASLTTPSS